jgi:hypothetical protein
VTTLSGTVESHSELVTVESSENGRVTRPVTTALPFARRGNAVTPPRNLRQRLRDGQVGLFTTFALVMLAAVIAIGLVLGLSFRGEAGQRGLAEGRTEALLMAQTAVGPIFDGRPLSQGLSAPEINDMNRLVRTSIRSGHVLRLRLRDLAGDIVFASDGSGPSEPVSNGDSDEVDAAADGSTVARLTTLNADDSTGPRGPAAVEIYMPLVAGRRINASECSRSICPTPRFALT